MQIGKGKNPIGKVRYISQKYSNNSNNGKEEQRNDNNTTNKNKIKQR